MHLPTHSHSVPPSDADLRFPIGREEIQDPIHDDDLRSAIEHLAELPGNLREAVGGLAPSQLDTRYRDGGWTVRQVVHHIADSHSNATARIRLALTEDEPTIKAYDEKAWAELHDSIAAPIEWSLELIEALHARWVMLLQSLGEAEWKRSFLHPDRGSITVAQATLTYAWHSRHHTAHITHLRAREDW